MKLDHIIIFVLLVGSFFLFYHATSERETLDAQIVKVIDGDTIVITTGDKVRLKGINTPEKNQYLNVEATKYLEGFINNSAEIISFGKDRYGRMLGYVFVDGQNLNEKILEKGFGHLYYYGKDFYYNKLEKAETRAKKSEIGIWSKSENYGCLEIKEFVYYDVSDDDFEKLVLKNSCDKNLKVVIKDDATHIYEKLIGDELILETQNIWNDDSDSVYVWDDSGLLLFHRYV